MKSVDAKRWRNAMLVATERIARWLNILTGYGSGISIVEEALSASRLASHKEREVQTPIDRNTRRLVKHAAEALFLGHSILVRFGGEIESSGGASNWAIWGCAFPLAPHSRQGAPPPNPYDLP
jgi:hypothetical protein